MKTTALKAGLLTLAAGLLSAAQPPELLADDGWELTWDKGFHLDSPDGKLKLKFGGRLHLDATFTDPDDEVEDTFGPVEDSSELRRGRIYFSGKLYGNVEFKAEYDFAGGDAEPKDVYVGLTKTPVGAIRVGHFKEPFSFVEMASSNDIAFIERPLPLTFAPVRNMGIMVYDSEPRYSWAVGAFRESDGFSFSEGDGKLNLTGRVTGLPVYRQKGKQLVHLGLSLSRKDLGDATFRYRQRPEVHVSPRFVDTGSFAADSVDLWSFEAAAIAGRYWASAEYFGAEADSPTLGDPALDGFYVEAGTFLTGEHRKYKASKGAISRPSPNKNFGQGGAGAWELALRYSTLDLTDAGLSGGEVDNFTVALNWYLNPVTRFMLNYVESEVDDVGQAGFLLLRFQVIF